MPYERHADLTTPPNKTVLWRYMNFARFIEMLESRTLWFIRTDQLEDPLEGAHTDAEIANIRKNLVKSRAEALINVFRSARSGLYVNCWRSGSAESLAMWDLYGKGSAIVAIKSTVGHIKKAVATYDGAVYISKVRYIDWNETPGLDNVLVACSRKDLSYEHEAEVRLIICDRSSRAATEASLGVRLPIDPSQLITEVIVGPREQKWIVRLVERILKRYELPQQVLVSNRLAPRS